MKEGLFRRDGVSNPPTPRPGLPMPPRDSPLMRIAIFAESYPPVVNGAATAISLLVHALRERHEVVVYAPHFPGHFDTDEDVRRFRSYRLPPEPQYPLAVPFSPRLFREFMRTGFDLVHTHSPFTLGQVGRRWAGRAGLPVITTYHTLYTEYTHYAPLSPRSWPAAGSGRSPGATVTRVMGSRVPTEPIREVLRGYGVKGAVEVIPTGVPFGSPPARQDAFPRQALQVPANAPVVLYAGRLVKEKNLGLLFRAFQGVLGAEPKAVLLLAGTGPWEAEAHRRVTELGIKPATRFAGVLDARRLALCYVDADVFGFPSLADTQGMVLVEAKAAGLPSVCVDAYGPSAVIRNGVDGILVPDDDAGVRCGAAADHPTALPAGRTVLRRATGCRAVQRQRHGAAYEAVYEAARGAVGTLGGAENECTEFLRAG